MFYELLFLCNYIYGFQGASDAAIKKAYRKQSLVLHPDKETGNEKAFMKLTKGGNYYLTCKNSLSTESFSLYKA